MSSVEYQGYLIVTLQPFLLKEIRPVGKGSVPQDLRGSFTSVALAKGAIDRYTSNKVKNNGSTKSTG